MSPRAAFLDAAQGLSSAADLLIVSVPSSTVADSFRVDVARIFPRAQVHMASSCLGSMSDHGVFLGKSTVTLFAISDPGGAYGSVAGPLSQGDVRGAALRLLKEAIHRAERPGEVPALVWVSTTPGNEEAVVSAIHHALGGQAPIYGGSSADDDLTGRWWVGDGDASHASGIAVTVFYPTAQVMHAFHAGYAPTQSVGVVTSAQGRVVRTIGHRPAMEVYREWTRGAVTLPVGGGEILSATTLFPLGVQVGFINMMPYYRLIHPAEALEDGSMALFAEAPEGVTLHLFSGSQSSIVNRAGRVVNAAMEMEGASGGVAGALVTFCAGCQLAVQQELSSVVEGIQAVIPGVPFLGQFSYGEQGTFPNGENCHGNLMISAVVFKEMA